MICLRIDLTTNIAMCFIDSKLKYNGKIVVKFLLWSIAKINIIIEIMVSNGSIN